MTLTDRMDNDQGWRDSRAMVPMSPTMVMLSPAYVAGYTDELYQWLMAPDRTALMVPPFRGPIVGQLWAQLDAHHRRKAEEDTAIREAAQEAAAKLGL